MFQGGVILLDTNGESCDADVSDGDESGEIRSSNFTFVGAEIRTGKSSIRSKQKAKKVSICSAICSIMFRNRYKRRPKKQEYEGKDMILQCLKKTYTEIEKNIISNHPSYYSGSRESDVQRYHYQASHRDFQYEVNWC